MRARPGATRGHGSRDGVCPTHHPPVLTPTRGRGSHTLQRALTFLLLDNRPPTPLYLRTSSAWWRRL